MSELQRWDIAGDNWDTCRNDTDGNFVKADEALARIAELERINKSLAEKVNDCRSKSLGMHNDVIDAVNKCYGERGE